MIYSHLKKKCHDTRNFKKAAELLKQYGFNELPSAKPKNVWQIALEVIQEPMFILFMFCGLCLCFIGRLYRRNDSIVLGFRYYFHHFFINTENRKNL